MNGLRFPCEGAKDGGNWLILGNVCMFRMSQIYISLGNICDSRLAMERSLVAPRSGVFDFGRGSDESIFSSEESRGFYRRKHKQKIKFKKFKPFLGKKSKSSGFPKIK